STVSGNRGQSGGGAFINRGLFEARNCTISGNTATGPGSFGGGRLLMGSFGQSTITSCTLTRNHSSPPNSGGGGGGVSIGANTTLQNTLIAGNTTAGGAPDCAGTLTSGGHNLIGDTSGCALTGNTLGTITGKDPLLAPLANNGGPTATHALLAGSPAIDSGDPAAPGGPGSRLSLDRSARFPPPARQELRHRGGGGSRRLPGPGCRAQVDRQRGADPVAGGRKRLPDGSDGQAFPPG